MLKFFDGVFVVFDEGLEFEYTGGGGGFLQSYKLEAFLELEWLDAELLELGEGGL